MSRSTVGAQARRIDAEGVRNGVQGGVTDTALTTFDLADGAE
ncbi:hypothetical protein [Streptomyces sp. NPDC002779]